MMKRISVIIAFILGIVSGMSASAGWPPYDTGVEPECTADSVDQAQETTMTFKRPVSQIYMLGIGGTNLLDTYLSPLRYHGIAMDLSGQWSKMLPWMRNTWVMRFDGGIGLGSAMNPSRTARMLEADARFAWGVAWSHRFTCKLRVTVGMSADLGAGILYLSRNSNNPASVKARAGVSLTASASFPFKLGRVPVLVSDEVKLPSLGLFFSPEYGETYYEIWLGNHKGLAHCGWWGNNFGIDNLLAFDLDIGPSALRLGYRYRLDSSWVCGLNTQLHRHLFVIGWIPHGIGLKRTRPSEKSISINSLY